MGSIRHWVAPGVLSDPDVVLYAATVSVWSRWFIWLAGVLLLAYRPGFWYPQDIEFLVLPVLLGLLNGLVHHRLLTNRPVTWRWMLLLCATDIALVTFRRRHRRRVQELHIPGLLSDPRRFRRGLLVLLAQSRLDDGGHRHLRRRVPERGLRYRPGRGQ